MQNHPRRKSAPDFAQAMRLYRAACYAAYREVHRPTQQEFADAEYVCSQFKDDHDLLGGSTPK